MAAPVFKSLERQIIERLLADLAEGGYSFALSISGDQISGWETSVAPIVKAMENHVFSEAFLEVVSINVVGRTAYILLVPENGYEVISDYSISLEPVIKPINDDINRCQTDFFFR